MRRGQFTTVVFWGVWGVLVGACSSEMVGRPPPPPVDWSSFEARVSPDAGTLTVTDKERAAADGYFRALSSPGLAELGAKLDEQAHFAFTGRKDAHGRERVVRAHDALFGAFDERKFATDRAWRFADGVQALEWTMSGVGGRDWMGIKAAQKPVVIKGLTLLWTNDDGLITDVHVYFDEALVRAQLGVGPKELMRFAQPPVHSEAPREFVQAGTSDENAAVAEVRGALNALEQGNEEAYLATMTDDIEVITLERQPESGKAAARSNFKTIRRAIGQLDTMISNVWGIQQFVVVEYSISGHQLRPLGFMPAQPDSVIKMFLMDVAELRDGKIARVWRYDNPSQVMSTP